MRLDILAIVIALLSLTWAISWALWTYRKSKLVRVTCDIAVLSFAKGAFFIPEGKKKKVPLKPGQLNQPSLSIFAHNLGSAPVAIEDVTVSLKGKLKKIHLKNCWLLVDNKGRVPKVLSPGETWEGLCDYYWLEKQLEESFGKRTNWELVVKVWDVNGRAYKDEIAFSSVDFKEIAKRNNKAI